jgi:hypothetical protein
MGESDPKLTIPQMAWSEQDASYQVHEEIARGATIPLIEIESQAWREWLMRVPSFAFASKGGQRFTARKEDRARGNIYWVAYRKVEGKLTHTYIGRPEDVTLSRLEQVAHTFAERRSKPTDHLPSQEQQVQHESHCEVKWQEQLLATKFFVPVAPHALIARPHLFSLLEGAGGVPSRWSRPREALARPLCSLPG